MTGSIEGATGCLEIKLFQLSKYFQISILEPFLRTFFQKSLSTFKIPDQYFGTFQSEKTFSNQNVYFCIEVDDFDHFH